MTDRFFSPSSSRRWLFWITTLLLFLIFLYLIRSILLPFVLGMGTAYFLDPAADRLERSGLSRNWATVTITGIFFTTLALLFILIVPIVTEQLSGLLAALPGYISDFEQQYSDRIAGWTGMLSAEHMETIRNAVSGFADIAISTGGKFLTDKQLSCIAVVNLLSLFLITPVVAFYLLRDWDVAVHKFDNLLPRAHAATIREQLRIIDRTLAGFVRGQILVCLIIGSYCALGLSIAGLKFGIVIGLMAGLLLILPYVGFASVFILGMGIALFQFDSFGPVIAVLAVFLSGQVLESTFITPKLVGDRVGLHPVWIIFGMLAGAALFGFVGVLIAVPATAVIGVLIRFGIQRYLESSYYHGGAAPGR